jgi:hypothetical protein
MNIIQEMERQQLIELKEISIQTTRIRIRYNIYYNLSLAMQTEKNFFINTEHLNLNCAKFIPTIVRCGKMISQVKCLEKLIEILIFAEIFYLFPFTAINC